MSMSSLRKSKSTKVAADLRTDRFELLKQRRGLPIWHARSEITKAVRDNQVVVIVGETGSGKTTQIPQFLHEEGYTADGMIGITQPRRVAATSVAQRVAQEYGCALGTDVGYSIRFDDKTSKQTKIKYMTDGMLLREIILDPLLRQYACLIVDEAHERTIHTDVLLGLIKQLTARRPELKVLVMSATLDAEQFAAFFGGARIITVEGRMYPVDVYYTVEPQPDYLDAALITTLQIHLEQPPGDILVFLTGQDEIEALEKLLQAKVRLFPPEATSLLVCPIFAALPSEQQLAVFQPAPAGHRKVILATNIAETSITINGVRYVVDSGVVKVRGFQASTGMDSLVVVPVSQAAARQRSGRAGREAAGTCYRLYTEESFEQLRPTTIPEILRCNLATVVLQLKAIGVDDLLRFEFMDKPATNAIVRALEQLYALGALDAQGKLSDAIGRKMAELPTEPLFSRAMLAAAEMGCMDEMLSLVSMLSVESIWFTPKGGKDQAESAKRSLMSIEGDHLTLLHVYKQWKEAKRSKQWCMDHYVNFRSMQRVEEIRTQLLQYVTKMALPCESCGLDNEPLRKALTSSFFLHTARVQADGSYLTLVDNQTVHIHPSSVLFGRKPRPECVLYNELVVTARQYMREVTVIDLGWLPELAPRYFSSKLGSSGTNADALAVQSSPAAQQQLKRKQPSNGSDVFSAAGKLKHR
eukprot:GILJ01004055.1.p1 GENE.GILJ01004055.1~~GILJ01004055.1.p1  ORF type:complete len:698 (+),score=71.08 GILJ01004055.1:38-2131(+)